MIDREKYGIRRNVTLVLPHDLTIEAKALGINISARLSEALFTVVQEEKLNAQLRKDLVPEESENPDLKAKLEIEQKAKSAAKDEKIFELSKAAPKFWGKNFEEEGTTGYGVLSDWARKLDFASPDKLFERMKEISSTRKKKSCDTVK